MFTRREPETAHKEASTESSTGYMAELEEWLDFTIFEPIENAISGKATPFTKDDFAAIKERGLERLKNKAKR